jgi:hypothetical protein
MRPFFPFLQELSCRAERAALLTDDQVIGIMLDIVVVGLLADKALFSPWERFLHRRWGTGQLTTSSDSLPLGCLPG